MKHSRSGIGYHPTTIGLVDDNQEYLEHLIARLTHKEQFCCIKFHEPQKALQFLTKKYQGNTFIDRCLLDKDSNEFDHLVTEFDIRVTYQEIYNPQRFNELTVLIIDYAMPGKNGLDICRQLKEVEIPIKIIMLTGEAGKDFAVEIFNEGSIDKFILKDTPNIMDVLIKTIHELQTEYFLNLSKMIFNKIPTLSKQTLINLEDPLFINLLTNIREQTKSTEFYLLDKHGSFLLLDIQGNPTWLIVKNEKEMHSLYSYAVDEEAPTDVVDVLQNRTMLPYFHTEQDLQTPPSGWSKYMHPAKELKGELDTYYYAVIGDTPLYKLDKDKILSYQSYLDTL